MIYLCFFFCFKQKTAYEMRISDWSSDVCSSDLLVDQEVRCGRIRRDGRLATARVLVLRQCVGIAPALERQRIVAAVIEFEDLANEAHVVAPVVSESHAALEAPRAIFKERDAAGTTAARSEKRRAGKKWGRKGK